MRVIVSSEIEIREIREKKNPRSQISREFGTLDGFGRYTRANAGNWSDGLVRASSILLVSAGDERGL